MKNRKNKNSPEGEILPGCFVSKSVSNFAWKMPNNTVNRGTKKRNRERRKAKQNKGKSPIRKELATSLNGAPAGTRTPDTLLKRQVLCRLSYWGKSTVQKNQNKSLSFVLERRIGGADTKPVGTGEALTQLRSGASPIRRGWDGGTRTHNIRVKVWCVTVTLRPTVQWKMGTGIIPIPVFVGWVKGLEPSTPGTTIRCSAN